MHNPFDMLVFAKVVELKSFSLTPRKLSLTEPGPRRLSPLCTDRSRSEGERAFGAALREPPEGIAARERAVRIAPSPFGAKAGGARNQKTGEWATGLTHGGLHRDGLGPKRTDDTFGQACRIALASSGPQRPRRRSGNGLDVEGHRSPKPPSGTCGNIASPAGATVRLQIQKERIKSRPPHHATTWSGAFISRARC
jgi:hypothetical protein